jgi:putative ATP-dependent endonuclease of the OLD family
MKLAEVHVKGYRCLDDLTLSFEELTALVGSGGVGKSAFLRAIRWFFEGGELEEDDLHHPVGGNSHATEAIVAVTFSDLNKGDREALGRYASGSSTTLTRSWAPERGNKLSGTALVFPDFSYVREGGGAKEKKARYKELFEKKGIELNLPQPASRIEDLENEMEVRERENPQLCNPCLEEATHLKGYVGTPILNDRFAYVFVEATTEAAEVIDGKRGSPLSQLLSALEKLEDGTAQQVAAVQEDAHKKMEALISSSRATELKKTAEGITNRFQEYVPGAEVELSDEIGEMRPPPISVLAQVRDGAGHSTSVDKHGHGLQRALVIAVLHELAESSALQNSGGSGESLSSLMLAIEEPELYQHPLQARALANTLHALARPTTASSRSVQVAYSTHSAHFVKPALFEDLRLCRRNSLGQTVAVAPSEAQVEAALQSAGFQGKAQGRVEKTLAASLGEAIFAKAVLLCEGKTDAALVESLAALDGGFEKDGIAVAVCWGKSIIPVALAILKHFEIPTYVLFDADTGPKDKPAQAAKNKELLALCGEQPMECPPRAVRDRCANFAGRLESDISELWPTFVKARNEVAEELGMPQKAEETYRRATERAGASPPFFTELLTKIRGLSQ